MPAISAHVPASVPRLRVRVLEVAHRQGDIPAAGGVLAGSRLPGGCSIPDRLAGGGGVKRDHEDGLSRGGPAPAKAERDDDGGCDDGSGGGGRGEAALMTSPHGKASDHRPAFRFGR